MTMDNAYQECVHYPDNGYDINSANLDQAMAQLYFQVQDGEHKIIYPDPLTETALRPAPWW